MLTTAQLQTLKTWLLANMGNMSEQQTAAALNSAASPAYQIYRTEVPVAEVMLNGFDWTRVDNLSVGKARIWEWMTTAKRVNDAYVFDPSKTNIRAGINETWKGTAADLAVRAAVYLHCFRAATVAEKLFATGTGSAADANGDGPGVASFTGEITPQDVIDALNS